MIKTPLSTMIGGAFWTPSATILGGTSKTFNQIIKSLFANGEQGFFYDPNDLTTMFQDAVGTVPVTGAGQPVGLILDKSKGLALGQELVTNGSFDNGTTGWVAEYQSTLSNVGGKLRVTATGINPYGVQTISGLTVGKTYKLTYAPFVKTGTGVWVINLGDKPAGYQVQYGLVREPALAVGGSFIFTATTTVLNIALVGGAGTVVGDYADFDNISVKEIAGNHAYQTTSASRPILRQNAVTGANYLEFDGTDDFLVTNSIDFTATDKVSLFAGVRKLSDVVYGQIAELGVDWFNNNGTFALSAPFGANATNAAFVSRGTTAVSRIVTNIAAPSSIVLVGIGNISGGACKLGINGTYGTSSASQGTGNYGNYPLYIGRRGGTSLPFNGHIYSLIGIGRLTTDAETTALEKLIAKNTGVTLSV